MRRLSLVLPLLIACMAFASCQRRGVVHLSIADAQQCHQILAREDDLFTRMVSALDEAAAGVDNREKLLALHKESRQCLEDSDRLVKRLYEKYGVAEADYRLDVFGGAFMPIEKQ